MAAITLDDIALEGVCLTPRVTSLKDAYFRALPEVCVERPRLITRYSLDHGLFGKARITPLEKAKCYRHALENRVPVVRHRQAFGKGMVPFALDDRQLFAGSTTGHFKGVPIFPELLGLSLWPELRTLNTRARNPYRISDEDADLLNLEVFPRWIDCNITELARKRCFAESLERRGVREAPELKLLERLVFFLASKANCISHTIPDFSRAVRLGLRKVIEEADARQAASPDPSSKAFYAATAEVLEGIVAYSNNLAGEAESLAASEPDADRKRELLDIAAIHRQVPEFQARTFREGLTTVWVCWTAIHLENPNVGLSLGRLDQLLYDLYRKDIDSGTLTPRDAVELVSCLWLKIGDHVPAIPDAGEQLFGGTGSNQAITVGGVDRDGNDAVNDLTYVMLRATELMRLRDPNLNARYCSGVNSPEYLRRICEVNLTTGATPALHNDKAVIKSLTGKGETLEQARDYGVIGCVEPASNGRSYGHSAAILLNLTSVLELALFNGRHRHTGLDLPIGPETGEPAAFPSFEAFQAAFESQAKWIVEQTTTLNNILGEVHRSHYPTPLLSALFEGPMEKGKDLIDGGAVVNSSGVALIGLADVADSLSAIRRVVFDERAVTFPELLDAIEKDFDGSEPLRRRLANPDKTPKYGNEDPAGDGSVRYLLTLMDGLYSAKTNYRGGRYRTGCWTMTNHAGFGRLMGATPNGRKARENFASGFTAVSGATPCLTKMLNSAAAQPVACLSNGIALNLKYTPEAGPRERMLDNFVASVAGYFDGGNGEGGMEIQFNVTSRDTFVDAVAHPGNHPELLVRVSGYTAYFKDLNPQMQKEIIDRTEYLLSRGTAVPYEPFPLPSAGAGE